MVSILLDIQTVTIPLVGGVFVHPVIKEKRTYTVLCGGENQHIEGWINTFTDGYPFRLTNVWCVQD